MNFKTNKFFLSLIFSFFFFQLNAQIYNRFLTENVIKNNSKNHILSSDNYRQLPPFWSSDFSNPQDWLIDNSNQVSPNGWNIGSTVNSWYNGITGIQSTSGGNFAELYNGDPRSNTQMLNVTYRMTTRNPIDVLTLAGTDQVTLSWEETGARFNDLQEVQISTDGVTFTKIADNLSYSVLSQSGGSMYPNPEKRTVNVQPYISNNSSSVWIRFEWTTNAPTQSSNPNAWVTYGWIIDDVALNITPNNVVKISDEVIGGWWVGYQLAGGIGCDYTYTPLSQVSANPYSFEAVITNNGRATQNMTLHAQVTDAIGGVAHSTTSNPKLLSSAQQDTFMVNQPFRPTTVGRYNISMWGVGDSAYTDTSTRETIVTDYIYGKDLNSYNGSVDVATATRQNHVLTYMDIYSDVLLTAVDVYIAPWSIPGANVYGIIYENDPSATSAQTALIYLDQTSDYTITPTDRDNWVTINFDNPVQLYAGTAYEIGLAGYQHPTDSVGVGASGLALGTENSLYDENGGNPQSNGTPTWYYISGNPMIRMNFTPPPPPSSVSQNSFNPSLKIYPNPSDDFININFGSEYVSKTNIKLVDVSGRLILEKDFKSSNSFILDVKDIEKGNYVLNITSKNYSQKTIITLK